MQGYGRLSLNGRLHEQATTYTLAGGGGGFTVATRITGERAVFQNPSRESRTVTVAGEQLHMSRADADAVTALWDAGAVFPASFPLLGPGDTTLTHERCFIEEPPVFEPSTNRAYTRYTFTIILL